MSNFKRATLGTDFKYGFIDICEEKFGLVIDEFSPSKKSISEFLLEIAEWMSVDNIIFYDDDWKYWNKDRGLLSIKVKGGDSDIMIHPPSASMAVAIIEHKYIKKTKKKIIIR